MLTLLLWRCAGLTTPSLAAPVAARGAAQLGTPSSEQLPPATAAEEPGRAEGSRAVCPRRCLWQQQTFRLEGPSQDLA